MNNKNNGPFGGGGGGIKPPHGHNGNSFGQTHGSGRNFIDDAFVKRHTARRAINQNEAFTIVGEVYDVSDRVGRNQKPKKERKYPIFSDVLELHDKIQALHASGSSFVEQSTMDITESDYMLLPFRLVGLVLKGIAYVLLGFFAFFFFNFGYCYYYGSYVNYNLFIPPIVLFLCFLHFYFNQYFLASMKQFVIFGEKIPRTTRFYRSVKNVWSGGELLILCITIASIFALLNKEKIVAILLPYANKLAEVAKNPLFSEQDKIELFLSSFAISWIVLCVVEFVFKTIWKRKFDELQKINMRNILLQHNRGVAVDQVLRGKV